MQTSFIVETTGPGFTDITSRIAAWLQAEIPTQRSGLLTLFIQHTSASLLIQENADPDVLSDLQAFFERLAPWREGLYSHSTEGPDDMPAHIRAALTQTSLSVPIQAGRLALGMWQGIYLWEHRARGSKRRVLAHLIV